MASTNEIPNWTRRRRSSTQLTYLEALRPEIAVMDAAAIALSRENSIPIVVFDLLTPGNIKRVILGEPIGSVIC